MMEKCIGALLDDISGAFDRVVKFFLLCCLRSAGVNCDYWHFFYSHLEPRIGKVCVQGKCSDEVTLNDTVFQGTVLGPPLWNIYFSGIASVTHGEEQTFADDLNVFRQYKKSCSDKQIYANLAQQQKKIHAWGKSRRIQSEPSKEEIVIIHPLRGVGNDFRLLGCILDPKLSMESAVTAMIQKIRPKIKSLLRTVVFHSVQEMIAQYVRPYPLVRSVFRAVCCLAPL